jgi:hypothetical protein
VDRLHDALVEHRRGEELQLLLGWRADLADQAARRVGIEARRLDALDVAEADRRADLVDDVVVAAEQRLGDQLAVDREADRLAQPDVLVGRRAWSCGTSTRARSDDQRPAARVVCNWRASSEPGTIGPARLPGRRRGSRGVDGVELDAQEGGRPPQCRRWLPAPRARRARNGAAAHRVAVEFLVAVARHGRAARPTTTSCAGSTVGPAGAMRTCRSPPRPQRCVELRAANSGLMTADREHDVVDRECAPEPNALADVEFDSGRWSRQAVAIRGAIWPWSSRVNRLSKMLR